MRTTEPEAIAIIRRIDGAEPVKCNETCNYWYWPNQSCACGLEAVYAVNQGELCYQYVPRPKLPEIIE